MSFMLSVVSKKLWKQRIEITEMRIIRRLNLDSRIEWRKRAKIKGLVRKRYWKTWPTTCQQNVIMTAASRRSLSGTRFFREGTPRIFKKYWKKPMCKCTTSNNNKKRKIYSRLKGELSKLCVRSINYFKSTEKTHIRTRLRRILILETAPINLAS